MIKKYQLRSVCVCHFANKCLFYVNITGGGGGGEDREKYYSDVLQLMKLQHKELSAGTKRNENRSFDVSSNFSFNQLFTTV